MSSEQFVSNLLEAERAGEVPDLLHAREQQLLAATQQLTFAGGGYRATFKYIHPGSTVKASGFSKGFRLDDAGSHKRFADNVISIAHARENDTPDTIIIHAAQLSVAKYMGMGPPGKKAEKKRERLLGGLLRGRAQGIAEMAASGVAMCLERASVTHNMCWLGGVPSVLLVGTVRFEKPGDHAFQIVRADDQNQLFDSTNPSIEVDDDAIYLSPTLAPVDAAKFLTGAEPVNTKLTHKTAGATNMVRASYSFQPSLPATFEGFSSLGFLAKNALGEMSRTEY